MKKTRYIAVPTRILNTLHGVEVQLYIALLFLCNVKHTTTLCDVTYNTLESMTGINRTYIPKLMQQLTSKGYLHNRATRHFGYRRDWSAEKCMCNGPLVISVTGRKNKEEYALLPCSPELFKLNGNSLLVFIHIMSCAKNECFCYPSLAQICKATGLSRATVIKCISKLKSDGYIIKANYFCKNGAFGHNRFIIAERVINRFGQAFLFKLRNWLNYAQSVVSDVWNNIISALKGNTYCKILLEQKIIPDVCFINAGDTAAADVSSITYTPEQSPVLPVTEQKRTKLPQILAAAGNYMRRKIRSIGEKIRCFFKI